MKAQDVDDDNQDFLKAFNKGYNEWFHTSLISPELRNHIESYEITMEQFDRITRNRQFQRYIALIDGRVRFSELPKAPHGEIIGDLVLIISNQLTGPNGLPLLIMVSDNGIHSWRNFPIGAVDVPCDNRTLKRPDASFKIRRANVPTPPPAWLKFQGNGQPYPNLVVEVPVNNESPTRLLDDMQRYFRRGTSVRVWIGVKYWAASRKFWCGWAERRLGGVGGRLHTQMHWPPDHHDITVATNIVYSIPMVTVFGPNIPIPPALPPILTIDSDAIRGTILGEV